jgi:hypothetical protein
MRFQVLTVMSMKIRAFWDIALFSFIVVDQHFRGGRCLLMMEAVRISKTLVYYYETTRCNIPEYSNLESLNIIYMSFGFKGLIGTP